MQSTSSDHNEMKQEILKNRKETEKFTNIWKLAHYYSTSESKKKSQEKLENI